MLVKWLFVWHVSTWGEHMAGCTHTCTWKPAEGAECTITLHLIPMRQGLPEPRAKLAATNPDSLLSLLPTASGYRWAGSHAHLFMWMLGI